MGVQSLHPADTERLMKYWAEGEGAKRIGWGRSGDFDRCRVLLAKHVEGRELDGLCSNLHQRATGARPGHAASEQKSKKK